MASIHIQLPAFHCQFDYTVDAETVLAHQFVEAVIGITIKITREEPFLKL